MIEPELNTCNQMKTCVLIEFEKSLSLREFIEKAVRQNQKFADYEVLREECLKQRKKIKGGSYCATMVIQKDESLKIYYVHAPEGTSKVLSREVPLNEEQFNKIISDLYPPRNYLSKDPMGKLEKEGKFYFLFTHETS